MKRIVLLILLLFAGQMTYAQKKSNSKLAKMLCKAKKKPGHHFSMGPKLGFGLASLHSDNLPINLKAQAQTSPEIMKWTANSRVGTYSSIGMFAQYDFTKRFSLLAEFSYNPFNSGFRLHYLEDTRNAAGTGTLTTLNSKAQVKSAMLSLPVMLRVNVMDNRRYSVGLMSGVRLNMLGSTHIKSSENEKKDLYGDNTFLSSRQEMISATASVDVFERKRNHFILGAATTFKQIGNGLTLDVRYNMPLTSSELYTNNANFINMSFINNEMFGYKRKEESEAIVPGYKLNDFKLGIVEVTISYVLFRR
jgi:hypothetical protein